VSVLPDYPVMFRLAGRRCLVVGAGQVGLRKVKGLLQAGADVVLVDPRLPAETLPENVEVVSRPFCDEDLAGACLVFAATDNTVINQSIAIAAEKRGIPVNIADDPDGGDFTLPACFCKGDLTVAVATGGVNPAVAAMVRDAIEKELPDEWQIFLEIAGNLRVRLLTSSSKSAYNQRVLQNLVKHGVLAMIANLDVAGIDQLLETEFGKGYSLADLEISLS
jgi:precorrin-2 dehydrogenase/sirohydrochlorin ferrochelatase